MISVVLINNVPASASALAAQLTPEWLARCARALEIQLTQHLAPSWPYAVGSAVRVGAGPSDLQLTDTPCNIIPSANDGGQEEAWHADELDGTPDSFLALDECRTLDDATEGLSHEQCEIIGNPWCSDFVTVPSGLTLPAGVAAGQQVAHEISDPVQDRSYPVDLGDGQPPILVSDFVLPAYFDTSVSGPTTYGEAVCGLPRVEPFSRTSGGYQIVRNADGSGETQAFGAQPRWARSKRRRSRARRILHLHPRSTTP